MGRIILLSAVAALIVLSAALATQRSQVNEAASNFVKLEDGTTVVVQLYMSVAELEGYPITDTSGEKIAEVAKILADAAGGPVALLIKSGGVLGIGEREAIVMLSGISYWDGELRLNATEKKRVVLSTADT